MEEYLTEEKYVEQEIMLLEDEMPARDRERERKHAGNEGGGISNGRIIGLSPWDSTARSFESVYQQSA